MTQRIAKYEILEKIAEGGFGVVYKARDPFIKRLVAIKTCSVVDQEMARRFFREAEIAGRFDHPNVTIVHDFGVEEQLAYLVQEYLDGEDLLAKIRRRDALPLTQKVGYLRMVAAGLAYAHGKGVVHRDIKPANLRVLDNGQVKILDFGIAKLVSSATQLTQKGVAVGTLGYLSPEQLRDQEVDTRTDIFSFGVVAYELLTYGKPFQGRQLSALMDEILNREPVPVSQRAPDCPPSLSQLVHRCLEKDRTRRFQTFEEVIVALDAVAADLAGRGEQAPAAEPPAASEEELPQAAATRPILLPVGAAAVPPRPAQAPQHPAAPPPSRRAAVAAPAAPPLPAGPPPPPHAPEVLPPLPAALLAPDPNPAAPLPETLERTAVVRSAPPAAPLPATGGEPVPTAASIAVAPAGNRPLWPWLVAVAGILLVVGGAGLWWLLRDETPPARSEPVPAPTIATTTNAGPVVAPDEARLVVLATPWGELTAIRDRSGRELPLPAQRTTPLVLTLQPGDYTLTLTHPGAPQPVTCDTEVVIGQAATCQVELVAVDVMQYFKEAGWWQ